ncbi:MAG: class I SAM-dependent methyltransferase [Thermodesulfobacteriota bacterium]|nr:class I SAM-dependent methyltransferase [Thermodesulfobacteriota bacterium]
MTDYYHTHYQAFHERTYSIDPGVFLDPFLKVLPPDSSLLDVGCASGRDLVWFQSRGLRVTGFEKSPGLAALARQNAGCQVIEGDFETFDFSALSFDAVLAAGALVHIPHARLSRVIANICDALVARGFFYISLKQGDGVRTDDTGRTFYYWQDDMLRNLFGRLSLSLLDHTGGPSVANSGDMWLGYVLRMND